ncbi:MAG: Smr/MutS family protein [Bacteroidetes bacterium]|nr:Smr/MutS family protein [Bacteroidota bacterium]
MKFNIGDKVSFLNDKSSGIITNILSNFRVLVTNEDGFEVSVSIDEIVPLADESIYKIDERKIDEKEEKKVSPPKLLSNEAWEVDLHLRNETENLKTDYEKLLYQLNYFRKCMDAAIAHRIKKIIFIHGVGKGTLKQEIIRTLKKYERAKQYDAPYKKYGAGAIVVEIS